MEYKNIRDTKARVANILQRLLDIGDLFIEAPGSTPDIEITNIDHPQFFPFESYFQARNVIGQSHKHRGFSLLFRTEG
jgi:hypothetical protein